jgi:hypothetical protein
METRGRALEAERGEIAFLPRVLIGRTQYGSEFFYDRKLGVMGRGPMLGEELRPVAMSTLRCYGSVWWEWTKLAAMLPAGAVMFIGRDDGNHGGGGGDRAA